MYGSIQLESVIRADRQVNKEFNERMKKVRTVKDDKELENIAKQDQSTTYVTVE
jgi:hypothetical protein